MSQLDYINIKIFYSLKNFKIKIKRQLLNWLGKEMYNVKKRQKLQPIKKKTGNPKEKGYE